MQMSVANFGPPFLQQNRMHGIFPPNFPTGIFTILATSLYRFSFIADIFGGGFFPQILFCLLGWGGLGSSMAEGQSCLCLEMQSESEEKCHQDGACARLVRLNPRTMPG